MSVTLGVLMQIAVSVQVADTIPARMQVPLVLRATVNGNTAPRMTMPSANGIALLLVSDVTRLGGGFGQAVATRETRYLLRASSPGTLVLPPVVATVGTQQAVSSATRIVVRPPPTNAVPALVSRAPVSRATTVNFHSLVTPDTVWAGEQVTLQVGVFIDDELRSRLQRNPEYVAPSVDGAVAYELPVDNDALPSRDVDGRRYRPFIFARALFALRAGRLTIPPARLGYTLGSAGTIFGRQERQTATTPVRSVVVRELPAEGRPADFTGAVGVYALTATVERSGGRVGDAVQLGVTVTGAGNVKLLPAPRLVIDGVAVRSAGETITVDTSDLLVRGSKTFRFLLTPRRDGALPLGDVRYPYFNPVRSAYEVASAPLGALRVAPGSVIEDDAVAAPDEALPLQGWSVEAVDDVTETWWFRALFIALGAPWLALITRRTLRFIPHRPSRERRLRRRDVPDDGSVPDAASVRRAFIRALSPLVQLRSDEPFVVDDVVRRLRRAGAGSDASEAAGALLRRLDLLTFGERDTVRPDAVATLQREAQAVQAQLASELSSKVRARLKAAVRSMLLIAGAGASLHAQPQPQPFRDGVAHYRARRFDAAAAAFATAAAAAPASAAAWADLGAAHWMRADTAGAIVAWQRSARLAPRDARAARMLAQHAASADWRLRVVPVKPNHAWLALLSVTMLLSCGAALARWRNGQISNPLLITSTLLIVAFAALAVVAERSLAAEGVVVVRQDVALRLEPVLAGEAGARARAGELATVTSASGTWRQVVVSAGRIGWVESDALRSLALDDGRDVARAEARVAGGTASP